MLYTPENLRQGAAKILADAKLKADDYNNKAEQAVARAVAAAEARAEDMRARAELAFERDYAAANDVAASCEEQKTRLKELLARVGEDKKIEAAIARLEYKADAARRKKAKIEASDATAKARAGQLVEAARTFTAAKSSFWSDKAVNLLADAQRKADELLRQAAELEASKPTTSNNQ